MLPHYREIMQTAWLGGLSDGTPCGKGSTMAMTVFAREHLPFIVEKYEIKTLCDAGAGDKHWIQHVEWGVEYDGYDLIPRHKDVKAMDITLEELPNCDAILCRFVLGHLDPASVLRALALFKLSGKYLIASNVPESDYSTEFYGTFNKWDLRREPFSLGEPLETYPDCMGHNLSIWKL